MRMCANRRCYYLGLNSRGCKEVLRIRRIKFEPDRSLIAEAHLELKSEMKNPSLLPLAISPTLIPSTPHSPESSLSFFRWKAAAEDVSNGTIVNRTPRDQSRKEFQVRDYSKLIAN